jgi:hypothetical protein
LIDKFSGVSRKNRFSAIIYFGSRGYTGHKVLLTRGGEVRVGVPFMDKANKARQVNCDEKGLRAARKEASEQVAKSARINFFPWTVDCVDESAGGRLAGRI